MIEPLTIAHLDAYRRHGRPDADYPANLRTFWAPVDDVHGVLAALLRSARRSVVLAMYGFADDELAEMLARHLDNPDMHVQVTLDRSQAGGVHEREILERWKHEFAGNSVAIGTSEKSRIMHRKVLLVDGVWRITGSTNWSLDGEQRQDNELTVLSSPSACAEARAMLDLAHDHCLQQMAARAAKATA